MKTPQSPNQASQNANNKQGSAGADTRHSKTNKQPLTIDLKAEAVTKKPAPATAKEADKGNQGADQNTDPNTGQNKTQERSQGKSSEKNQGTPVKSPTPNTTPNTAPGTASGTARPPLVGNLDTKPKSQAPQQGQSGSANQKAASQSAAKPAPARTTASAPLNKKTAPVQGQRAEAGQASTKTRPPFEAKPRATPPAPSSEKLQARPHEKNEPNTGPSHTRIMMGRFGAAVIGGGVALSLAGLLQYGGFLSSPAPSSASNTSAELAQNFVSQEAFENNQTELMAQIKNLQSRLEQQTSALDTALNKQEAETETQVTQVQLDGLVQELETTKASLATQSQTISTLQTALSKGQGGENVGLETLSNRLDDFSTQLTALSQTVNESADKPMAQSSEISSALTALKAQVPSLQQEITTVKTDLTLLSEKLDQNQNQTSALQQQTITLQEKITQGDGKQVARAIAAAQIKDDIDRGTPFEASFATFKALAPDTKGLDSLSHFAKTGVPTSTQLSNGFETISDDILTAINPKPKDDLTSRLLNSARSFIKVKHTAPLEGNTPEALMSQISGALKQDQLQQAANLWAQLPQAGQEASKQWHEQLQARIQANGLMAQIVQSFLQPAQN